MSQGRIAYLDYLRVLATFGVIFIHVFSKGYFSAPGSYDWYINVVGDSLVRWSVPVFVMISGALFLKPEKDVPLNVILKKYIPRLAVAYLFWWVFFSAFCICGDWINTGQINTSWLKPHVHLWFLPMLMCVYLLVPLLRLISAHDKLMRYALILWAVYISGSFVFVREFSQITELFIMNRVFGYAGFFLLGYYLSTVSLEGGLKGLVYTLGVIGALVGICGNILLSLQRGESDSYFLTYLSPHVLVMAAALFVWVKDRADVWYKRTGKVVEHVRADLFGIYLIHPMWLIVLNQTPISGMCNQIISLPVMTILIFVLSLYSTKLIRLIPLLRNVVR